MGLEERIDDFAAALRRREAGHAEDVAGARLKAQEVHGIISSAIDRFNAAIEAELRPRGRRPVPRCLDLNSKCNCDDQEQGRDHPRGSL